MPFPQQEQSQNSYEGSAEYADENDGIVSKEETRIRLEIANKLFTIAREMEVSFKTISNLINHKHELYGGKLCFVLVPDQDREFSQELGNINRHVGKAQTIIGDTYLELKDVPSVIGRIKNKFFYLDSVIKEHRRDGRFYQYHVKAHNQFIYPFFVLDNNIKDLIFLLQELCGMLDGGGEFLKDVIYLLGTEGTTGAGGGGDYGRSYGYPRYPSKYTGTGYDEFGKPISSGLEPKPELRMIGDAKDTKT